MNTSNKHLYLVSSISLAVGFILGFLFLALLQSSSHQRERQVKSFFYKTMHAILEGTYNSDEGSVLPEALKTIIEYKHKLGNKCQLSIVDSSSDYCEGTVFFPSGDCFYVYLYPKGKRWVIMRFDLVEWERRWRNILHHYRIGEL